MRQSAIAVVALLALTFAAQAEDADQLGGVDLTLRAEVGGKDRLVGVWTCVKTDAENPPPVGAKIKFEFTRDGKLNLLFSIMDTELKISGAYEVAGDKLSMTLKVPGGRAEQKETVTIKELTSRKLVLVIKKAGKTETTEFEK